MGALRRSLDLCDQRVRTGRDGRRRPVDPVPGQLAVAKLVADNPTITIRKAAGVVGVAPSTVQRVVTVITKPEKHSSAEMPAGARVIRGSADVPANDRSFQACQGYADAASWLAKTTVTLEDLTTYLGSLPLSRTYEVVDECRRRARRMGRNR